MEVTKTFVLNTKTNRYVEVGKYTHSQMNKEKIIHDTIYNPQTQFNIRKYSRKHRQLMRDGVVEMDEKFVLNPISCKLINRGGRLAQKLKRDGIISF